MDENLSIFKKGLFLVGIPLLAQLLFLAMLLKIRSDEDEAQHWAMHTKDVMVRAEGAFRLASRANSDLRSQHSSRLIPVRICATTLKRSCKSPPTSR